MHWLGLIISMLILGLFAGALARLLVPGKQNMSIGMTLVLGLVGSFVGGFLGHLLFHNDAQEGFLQPAGIIGSIIGAVIVIPPSSRKDVSGHPTFAETAGRVSGEAAPANTACEVRARYRAALSRSLSLGIHSSAAHCHEESSMSHEIRPPGAVPASPSSPAGETLQGVDVDVDTVARVALDCASVLGLGDEIATYRHGRRIPGVRVRDGVLQLHVLGRYDVSVEALCAQVGAAVRPLVPGMRIDVAVVDIGEPFPFDLAEESPRGGHDAWLPD